MMSEVLCVTRDHVSAATALPLGVLSVYLREFPGDWHPF